MLPYSNENKNTIERTEWISILTERAEIEDQALLTELKNAIKQDKTIVNEPHPKRWLNSVTIKMRNSI